MRTIKFRAWNPDSKKMTYIPNYEGSYLHLGGNHGFIKDLDWYVSNGQSSCAYSDRSTLMQSTGLLDKNGKEIYEGDIVSYKDKYGLTYSYDAGVVKFANGSFGVENEWGFDDFGLYTNTPRCNGLKTMKVVGNIYENSELIK